MPDPVRNHARASAPEGPMGRAISNGTDKNPIGWFEIPTIDLEGNNTSARVMKRDVVKGAEKLTKNRNNNQKTSSR